MTKLVAFFLAFSLAVSVTYAQDTLYIHKKIGGITKIPVTNIDSMIFYASIPPVVVNPYNIEVTLDAEADVSISPAPLMYNKKHAYTLEIDDALNDIYLTLFKLFSGGVPEKEPGYIAPGLFMTDGCGHNIPFKATTTAFIKRFSPAPVLDWCTQAQKYGGNNLNTTQMDSIINAGYGINDHGYYSDMQYITDVNQAVLDYIIWSESRYKFRPLDIVAPGGVTFDYTTWKTSWFNNGARFATKLSSSSPDITRVDNLNVLTMTEPLEVGRYQIESKDSTILKAKIDALMASGNNQWLRSFGHLIEPTTTYINYPSLKAFVNYLQRAYGKDGADNLWVTSTTDVISYLYCRNGASFSEAVNGKTHTFTINSSQIPSYITKRMLTLMFASSANITNIKVNGYSYSKNTSMVNITF